MRILLQGKIQKKVAIDTTTLLFCECGGDRFFNLNIDVKQTHYVE